MAYEKGFDIYFKLFTLLYADDTIVLAQSENELQLALDALSVYCERWFLRVNTDKTKVVIFSRGKIRNIQIFRFENVKFFFKLLNFEISFFFQLFKNFKITILTF